MTDRRTMLEVLGDPTSLSLLQVGELEVAVHGQHVDAEGVCYYERLQPVVFTLKSVSRSGLVVLVLFMVPS